MHSMVIDNHNQNFYTVEENDGTFTAVVQLKNFPSESDASFVLTCIIAELTKEILKIQQDQRTYH